VEPSKFQQQSKDTSFKTNQSFQIISRSYSQKAVAMWVL
jgi:hypothetical protein